MIQLFFTPQWCKGKEQMEIQGTITGYNLPTTDAIIQNIRIKVTKIISTGQSLPEKNIIKYSILITSLKRL